MQGAGRAARVDGGGRVRRQRRQCLPKEAETRLRATAGSTGVGPGGRGPRMARRPAPPVTQGARGLHRHLRTPQGADEDGQGRRAGPCDCLRPNGRAAARGCREVRERADSRPRARWEGGCGITRRLAGRPASVRLRVGAGPRAGARRFGAQSGARGGGCGTRSRQPGACRREPTVRCQRPHEGWQHHRARASLDGQLTPQGAPKAHDSRDAGRRR